MFCRHPFLGHAAALDIPMFTACGITAARISMQLHCYHIDFENLPALQGGRIV